MATKRDTPGWCPEQSEQSLEANTSKAALSGFFLQKNRWAYRTRKSRETYDFLRECDYINRSFFRTVAARFDVSPPI